MICCAFVPAVLLASSLNIVDELELLKLIKLVLF